MPSRIIHGILNHILETSDVDFRHEDPPRVFSRGGFQQYYMGTFAPEIRLRTIVRGQDLENLPVDVYHQLVELFEEMVTTGRPIDVNRKFKGVRLLNIERVLSPSTFEPDFRMEFTMDEINYDEWAYGGPRRSAILREDMVSGELHPVYFGEDVKIWGQKTLKVKKKVEEHFDKDLFEL